ncbi:uncharacterized protein [Procambarus clarkii]|uniref:uncharacterized protein n=1 Tax=Procambarus clarkii TaxID=6728 RepID=UPI003742B7A5
MRKPPPPHPPGRTPPKVDTIKDPQGTVMFMSTGAHVPCGDCWVSTTAAHRRPPLSTAVHHRPSPPFAANRPPTPPITTHHRPPLPTAAHRHPPPPTAAYHRPQPPTLIDTKC